MLVNFIGEFNAETVPHAFSSVVCDTGYCTHAQRSEEAVKHGIGRVISETIHDDGRGVGLVGLTDNGIQIVFKAGYRYNGEETIDVRNVRTFYPPMEKKIANGNYFPIGFDPRLKAMLLAKIRNNRRWDPQAYEYRR